MGGELKKVIPSKSPSSIIQALTESLVSEGISSEKREICVLCRVPTMSSVDSGRQSRPLFDLCVACLRPDILVHLEPPQVDDVAEDSLICQNCQEKGEKLLDLYTQWRRALDTFNEARMELLRTAVTAFIKNDEGEGPSSNIPCLVEEVVNCWCKEVGVVKDKDETESLTVEVSKDKEIMEPIEVKIEIEDETMEESPIDWPLTSINDHQVGDGGDIFDQSSDGAGEKIDDIKEEVDDDEEEEDFSITPDCILQQDEINNLKCDSSLSESDEEDYQPPPPKIKRKVGRPRKCDQKRRKTTFKSKNPSLAPKIDQAMLASTSIPRKILPFPTFILLTGCQGAGIDNITPSSSAGPCPTSTTENNASPSLIPPPPPPRGQLPIIQNYCGVCSAQFATITELSQHNTTVEHQQKFAEFEEKRQQLLATLPKPKRTIVVRKKLGCQPPKKKVVNKPCTVPGCTETFPNHKRMVKHQKIAHPDNNDCICETCGNPFYTIKALTIHRRVHDDPFLTCGECLVKFSKRTEIRKHKVEAHPEISLKDTPFFCKPVCWLTFPTQEALDQHMKEHEDEYKCKVCNRWFANRPALKKHAMIHTGEKPHQCQHCDKAFLNPANLREHVLRHTGNAPHKCDDCGAGFFRKKALATHKDAGCSGQSSNPGRRGLLRS